MVAHVPLEPPTGPKPSSCDELRNIWLSHTEQQALLKYLRSIELGLSQLTLGRPLLTVGERQAMLLVEQGCLGVRQIADALKLVTADGWW